MIPLQLLSTISIHALLAESDGILSTRITGFLEFLSTLSLRRATYDGLIASANFCNFYPRSPCGERRYWSGVPLVGRAISIHALLAESDGSDKYKGQALEFLSTLSLRRATILCAVSVQIGGFLSTLSLRRATMTPSMGAILISFLSTLSLRRATTALLIQPIRRPDFYPRSPCGERQPSFQIQHLPKSISIHALLAESD